MEVVKREVTKRECCLYEMGSANLSENIACFFFFFFVSWSPEKRFFFAKSGKG